MQIRKKMAILLVMLALALTACASPSISESPLARTVAPDFELENALGGKTSLAEYSGTPVLLFFHMAVG